jgi:hypothetical protein
MFKLFSSKKTSEKKLPIVVVSGLPRSGTSMMMKMLDAGGIPIVTDHLRNADESNPNGYYEFERVKKLKDGDIDWLKDAAGHSVKVISALLEYLPPNYQYQIIFMRRSMSEILASQKQMLIQRGESYGDVSDADLAKLFEKHLEFIQDWLTVQPNFNVLSIYYNAILQDPEPDVIRINEFLGGNLDLEAMVRVLDKSLYRQRKV